MRNFARCFLIILFLDETFAAYSATVSDTFNTNVNYLINGVAGTLWDGVYFGAGEFANSGIGGGGPGATVQCDANLSGSSKLTVQSTGTAWEGADDDGFFLFKVVKGNFSAVVHVVSPYDNSAYNTAGLQARAFAANGNPSSAGKENFVSWTRFDEYNFANYLRSEVNGGVSQVNPGGYPNSAYWLRLDRVGNTFRCYQRTNSGDAWQIVSFPAPVNGTNLTRTDLSGLPLQVGVMHATFNNQLGVQFSDFSITATNFDSLVAPPGAPTGLALSTNSLGIGVSWTPGAGSAGSLVLVWSGTNGALKQIPSDGFTYTGNAGYGLGSQLPAANYYVAYTGTGSSVTITNLGINTTYRIAVFSYSGSGGSTTYNRRPVTGSVTIPPNPVFAHMVLQGADVVITFSANPGKWYWLQYSDSLSPTDWHTVEPGPRLAAGLSLALVHAGGASQQQRFYRVQQIDPLFGLTLYNGAITSLKRTSDSFDTEFIAGGRRLGDANLRYRQSGTNWLSAQTATQNGVASVTYSNTPDGTQYVTTYRLTNGLSGALIFQSIFTFYQDVLLWTLNFTNLSGQALELGDLALPLPMNTTFSGITSSVLKHSFISGYGSFLFWMRPNSVGPYLTLTPAENTKLEYWDVLNGGYEAYVHSAAAGAIAATNYPTLTTQGNRWRQTNTSLTIGPGGSQQYGFKFQWAADYDGVRQALVREGKIDVHIVPGMTVPTNLVARIALNTTQAISAVEAEFPGETQVQALGANGSNQLYQVQFSRLGENRLTVRYGANRTMFLEFFVTEPIETLIQKRASFLVSKQINDASKWYDGLFAEWNMNSQVLVTPDNHDTITGFVVYEIASDDAGESRPAFMGVKESVYPVASEVAALDHYIQRFVWGGLQRATNETFSYGVYGIPDWHNLRTNNNLSIGRGYDYPHIIVMYYGMYQVAKYHPEIVTSLSAQEYLRRAHGTAMAMFSYGGGQATSIGLMNELIITDLIGALQTEGMTNEAAALKIPWEQKINYYVSGNANLFGSEYAFDSTGFESQQAYARYAFQNAATMGATNPPAFLQKARRFMDTQIAANIFARGWLETAYYYYGSDYRGGAGNDYVLSYMAQMGGWSLLDYGLNFATNATDYLRLGYASILSAWATMNTGTPASGYGFWYPGAANDGGCGGGFEPSPYNTTWLGQPMHRGNWYYSCEENLGFCGALRAAATILADDPIFGRFCYGGTWVSDTNGIQVTPLDGVRRRFHAMFTGTNLHLNLENDRFASGSPIGIATDLSQATIQIETENPFAHSALLHLSASTAGTWVVTGPHGLVGNFNLLAGQEAVISLPMDAGLGVQVFSLAR